MNARRCLPLLITAAALVAPAAAQAWESIGATRPGVAGYDPDRGRLVQVGSDRRVHEWEYGAWFARPTLGPGLGQRLSYGPYTLRMVHDPVQHRMLLLFTSGLGYHLFGFDGETWAPLPLPSLSQYAFVRAMAFDAARSRLVLVAFDATHEFDGQSWTTTVTGGTPSIDTLAFDPQQQRLIGYGSGSDGLLGQVSTYDGIAWTSTTIGTPPYRVGASLGFDPLAGVMVLHGCTEVIGAPPDADDWEQNGSQWTRIAGTGGIVDLQDSLLSTPNGLLRVEQGPFRRVTMRLAQRWIPVGATVPPSSVTRLVADPAHGSVQGLDDSVAGTTSWRLADRDWVPTGSAPGSIAAMAFDPLRRVLLGVDLSNPIPSEWTFDGTSWSSAPFASNAPPHRLRMRSAFDAAHGEFLLFGGDDLATLSPSNDLWSYSNGIWWQRAPNPPIPPRDLFGMAYDPVHQRTLVVGGHPGFDDTWSWNGTTWQQLSPTHAPFSGPTALVFDPLSQQPLAINYVANDTIGVFAHDGTNWNLRSRETVAMPVPYQLGLDAAVEPGTNRIVVSVFGTTLRLTPTPASVEPQGVGCGTPLRISARTFARVGEVDAGIDLRGVPGGALLGLSLMSANVPFGGGCALQLGSLDLALILGMNAAGCGSVTLPVPNAPALADITVFAQAAQLDAASPIGIAVSGRLAITIGE